MAPPSTPADDRPAVNPQAGLRAWIEARSPGEKTAIALLVVAIGLGGGIEIAQAMKGYIAYWGVVEGPFLLTIRVALAATAIAAVAGIAVGYLLARGRFPGRDLIETVGSLPIILPPTVMGFYLLEYLSPSSSIGGFLTRVTHEHLTFDYAACVIAATIAAFPFCMRAARAAIEGVDARLEHSARAMGLPNWRVALQVTLPLARRGIGAGVTLGCARALGEYGATLMVGGNIDGRTETLSLAILDVFTTPERNTMLLILVLMATTAMVGIGLLSRSRT